MQTDLFGPVLTVNVRRRARRLGYRLAVTLGYRWHLTTMTIPVYEVLGFKRLLERHLNGSQNETWYLYLDVHEAFVNASAPERKLK